MPVEYRTGDLFEQPDLRALGHGVNCTGVMGAGIAPLFRRRWPAMYAKYRELCQAGRLQPGGMFPWQAHNPDLWIYNLATQPRPGQCATLRAVRQALVAATHHAEVHGVGLVGIPRIGCGLGGLDWTDVRDVVEWAGQRSRITIVVLALPGRP